MIRIERNVYTRTKRDRDPYLRETRKRGRLERVGTPHFDFKFPEYSIVPSGKGNDITILLTISFAPGGVEDKDVSPSGGTSRSNTKQ